MNGSSVRAARRALVAGGGAICHDGFGSWECIILVEDQNMAVIRGVIVGLSLTICLAARAPILIDIHNRGHIEISGLALRLTNPIDPKWPSRPPLGRPRAAAIHVEGNRPATDP